MEASALDLVLTVLKVALLGATEISEVQEEVEDDLAFSTKLLSHVFLTDQHHVCCPQVQPAAGQKEAGVAKDGGVVMTLDVEKSSEWDGFEIEPIICSNCFS